MKKKRFSTEQIVAVLKQIEMGLVVSHMIRQLGLTEQTLYRGKKQYGGLQSEQVCDACHGYSERRACALTRQHRSTQRIPSIRDPRTAVRQRMHESVRTRVRYGDRRVHIMLNREGWSAGRNLIYRLYREEGLCLPTKRLRRRKMAVHREAHCQPQRPNEARSLDFIHDELSNGKKFRAFTVVDNGRSSLARRA